MTDINRNDQGKFAYKGNSERKVRTIRLTDETWNLLGDKADENDMSKADFLESLAANEVNWNNEKDVESDYNFDVDEVAEILQEILTLKSREGTKMKQLAKRGLEIMGIELEADN